MSRPATVRENAVEAALRDAVESVGGECVKLSPGGGWPDRVVLWPDGSTCLVELKRPRGGIVSPRQMSIKSKLKGMGHHVHIITTKEAAREFVRNWKIERNIQ